MIRVERTNSKNDDFVKLVAELNAHLKIMDGDEHEFYMQFNNIDVLNHVVVLYENSNAVACGALKWYNDEIAELKRMYVKKEARRKGYAGMVLKELEVWSKELGYKKCMLETGKRMSDAIAFYVSNQYLRIPNFGQYKHKGDSICFEKTI